MEELKKLLETIENTEITNNFEDIYYDLYNACREFQENTDLYEFDKFFEDIFTFDTIENMVECEFMKGGLSQLKYFLADSKLDENGLFRVNTYGKLVDITRDELEEFKQDIIDRIKEIEEELLKDK